jgi:UDP-N-acetyl-D-galactosamine dehydrogenase
MSCVPKNLSNKKLAVIGLGYVGLPLAVEFGKKMPTMGFDICSKRINELQQGFDKTLEVTQQELTDSTQLTFSCDIQSIRHADVYIVTVPTPVDKHKTPNLMPLKHASEMLAKVIKKSNVVIFESTVYPGVTEEVCVPIIEEVSGLKLNIDFFAGYSPERINPGDKEHSVTNIIKVTSGSTTEAADFIDKLYQSIITAGTYKASSIKVAEAAKVIENTQRDLNIALINELSIIFSKLEIDTEEVLKAAATKWNFLPFRPGLVGGHCIGVDPYYLTYKAQELGYNPQVILAGRRINDKMGVYVANQLIKSMLKSGIQVKSANILIMGLTFKENCPDIRNTKVVDIISELNEYGVIPDIYDPNANAETTLQEYGLTLTSNLKKGRYDAIIIAVAHSQFLQLGIKGITALTKSHHIIYDLKHMFPAESVELRL